MPKNEDVGIFLFEIYKKLFYVFLFTFNVFVSMSPMYLFSTSIVNVENLLIKIVYFWNCSTTIKMLIYGGIDNFKIFFAFNFSSKYLAIQGMTLKRLESK